MLLGESMPFFLWIYSVDAFATHILVYVDVFLVMEENFGFIPVLSFLSFILSLLGSLYT